MTAPRHISSVQPYGEYARKYVDAGFKNPLPLKERDKSPIVKGFHGRDGAMVDLAQLSDWVFRFPKSNIGLRLWSVVVNDVEYEVVALDVDHHDDKYGGDQLVKLEEELGALPETWINTARGNGIHGHRLFLVPVGLRWRGTCGKAGKHIDVICRESKYIAVFPSYHPEGGQYYWYAPGVKPDGINWSNDLPQCKDLSVLPDKWVDFLTNGRTEAVKVSRADGSADDLLMWAKMNFVDKDNMCSCMSNALVNWIEKIENSAESYPVMTSAHHNLLRYGAEGHTGWWRACSEFGKHYLSVVVGKSKRNVYDAKGELARSGEGELRNIKGEVDAGNLALVSIDPCYIGSDESGKDPGEYPLNDDGNADHFLDLYCGSIYYVMNFKKWIIWDGSRWIIDKNDSHRTLYRKVKIRQEKYADKLWMNYRAIEGHKGATELKNKAAAWARQAKSSGMVSGVSGAIEAAKTVDRQQQQQIKNVTIDFKELDRDRRALGIDNGVMTFKNKSDLDENGSVLNLIENNKELMITRNTNIPYIPLKEQKISSDPLIRKGYKLFSNFIKTFIVTSLDAWYFQKLCGSTLIGDSGEKIAIFFHGATDTGKSTMLDLLLISVGDYGCVRNPDIFKSVHLNPALATALSARILGVDELGDNEINSALFKNITGGAQVACELKGKNEIVEDFPQFTPIITTNRVPRVPGEDTAFVNRLCVVKFLHQVSKEDRDKGNETKRELLEYGKVACHAWLIEGAARSVVEGIRPFPKEIRIATEEFTAQLSEIGVFVRECIERMEGNFVRNEDLFNHFRAWAIENNFDERHWTPTKLGQRMGDLGFESSRPYISVYGKKEKVQVRGWKGIKLVKNKYEQDTSLG